MHAAEGVLKTILLEAWGVSGNTSSIVLGDLLVETSPHHSHRCALEPFIRACVINCMPRFITCRSDAMDLQMVMGGVPSVMLRSPLAGPMSGDLTAFP